MLGAHILSTEQLWKIEVCALEGQAGSSSHCSHLDKDLMQMPSAAQYGVVLGLLLPSQERVGW